jgi:hypothetical protein
VKTRAADLPRAARPARAARRHSDSC